MHSACGSSSTLRSIHFLLHSPASISAMAPKKFVDGRTAGQKLQDARKATMVLSPKQKQNDLVSKREDLKREMKTLAKEKKEATRHLKKLKEKAAQLDLNDLMQMVMMKTYNIVSLEKRHHNASSSSSSSSAASIAPDDWTPKTPKEAFEKLEELSRIGTHPEVLAFAESLKKGMPQNIEMEVERPDDEDE